LGNNELVELLKELANQMGIAVDWTSENIRPYIIDIMGRLAKYEIFTSVIWILLFAIIVFIAVQFWKIAYKKYKDVDDYEFDDESFFWISILLGLVIIGVVIGIVCQLSDIGEAIYMPEVLLIEKLRSLSK